MACQKELLPSSPQEVQGFFFLLPTKWPPSLYFLITWTISAISCMSLTSKPWATTLHLLSNLSAKKVKMDPVDQNQIFFSRHISEKRGVCNFYSGHRAKNIITQSLEIRAVKSVLNLTFPPGTGVDKKLFFLWTCIPYIIYILGKFLLWRTFSFLLRLEKWKDLST